MAAELDPSVFVVGVDWLDSSTVLIDRYAARGGARQIWRMDLGTGHSSPVTQDVADYRGLSTTADRQMAVSTRVDKLAGIWVEDAGDGRMVPTVPDSPRFPSSVSLDNQGDLAYDTATDVSSDIWIQRPGSDRAQLLYSHGQQPALSPDGLLVAFCDLAGTRHISVIRNDGSQLAPLTDHGWRPSVTPDGRTVVFTSNAADGSAVSTLWAVPIAGGAARELTHRRSSTFSLSPDGQQLMFRSSDHKGGDVVVTCDMPECTNERELHLSIFNGLQANCRFAPDSASVGCLKLDQPSDIWLQPLDGGPRRQLTHFLDRDIADFVWSPDGKRLAVTRKLVQADIVLLTGFR
jgi:Tol biopolymer transport system component